MKREEIKEKIPGITPQALDWLMAGQGQAIKAHTEKIAQLEAQLETAAQKLEGYDPEWQQKLAAQGLELRLGAALAAAGVRSERAALALMDTKALAAAENQPQAIGAAVESLKQSHDYLFRPADTGAFSAAAGCAAPAENPDSALRAAFGL